MSFSATDTSGTAVTLQVGGNNADTVFSGSMTAGGPLVKIGTGNLVLSNVNKLSRGITVNGGTLTLTGANRFAGQTSVNAGILQLGNVNALQFGILAVNVDNGVAFEPGIGTFALAGLSGSHSLSLVDTSGAPVALQLGNDLGVSTYSAR